MQKSMPYKIDLTYDPNCCLDSEYVGDLEVQDSNGHDLRHLLLSRQPVSDSLIRRLSWRMIVKNESLLPDYGEAPLGGFAAVSTDVKQCIEALEPDVHQFVPLDAVDPKGNRLAKNFYYLNVLKHLTAVDVERSDVGYSEHHMRDYRDGSPVSVKTMYFSPRAGVPPRLTLRSDVIRRHHLWTGTRDDLRTAVFMSDRLFEQLQHTRISSLIVLRCEET